METYLAIKPRNSRGGDPSMEMMLWGGVSVVLLTIAIILASKAIGWFRDRKHPQQEDEVRR